LKTDVNVSYRKYRVISKKTTGEKCRLRIRIRNPAYMTKDPDPSQNVTDPEYWFLDQKALQNYRIKGPKILTRSTVLVT
jgi:hypothetical protein